MDIKSSFTYDSKIANEAYAAKASAMMARENKLTTGQKVSEPSSDAASLQIKSRTSESAEVLENINAASSAVGDVARAEEMIREANRRILEQSGDSVLAQANQSTDAVTKLLG